MPFIRSSTKIILSRRLPTFTLGAAVPPSSNIVNLGFANITKTFTGVNNGIYFPARSTVIVSYGADQTTAPGSFKIGRQTATEIANCANRIRLYQATMPGADQPDEVEFTTAGGMRYVGVQVAGWFKNLRSTTPVATGNSASFGAADPQTLSASISVPNNPSWGIIASYSVTAPSSLSWTNTTAANGDTFNTQAPTVPVTLGTAHTETPGGWNSVVSGNGASIQYGTGVVAGTWN